MEQCWWLEPLITNFGNRGRALNFLESVYKERHKLSKTVVFPYAITSLDCSTDFTALWLLTRPGHWRLLKELYLIRWLPSSFYQRSSELQSIWRRTEKSWCEVRWIRWVGGWYPVRGDSTGNASHTVMPELPGETYCIRNRLPFSRNFRLAVEVRFSDFPAHARKIHLLLFFLQAQIFCRSHPIY